MAWFQWESLTEFDAWHDAACDAAGLPRPGFNQATGVVTFIASGVGAGVSARCLALVSYPGDAVAADRASLRVDGVPVTGTQGQTGTPSAANPTYALHIGSAAGGGYIDLAGSIAEIVIVDRELAPDEIAAAEDYLMNKWAIST